MKLYLLSVALMLILTEPIRGALFNHNPFTDFNRKTVNKLKDGTRLTIKSLKLSATNGKDNGAKSNIKKFLALLQPMVSGGKFSAPRQLEVEKYMLDTIKERLGEKKVKKLESGRFANFLEGEQFDIYKCSCSTYGDPHVKTFDKRYFSVNQVGKYEMVKTTNEVPDKCRFSVDIMSDKLPRWKLPFVTEVTVKFNALNNQEIVVKRDLSVKYDDTILQEQTNLNSEIVFYPHTTGAVKYIRISYPACKINILYKESHGAAFVSVDDVMYARNVDGLCGSCDGDKNNDKTSFNPIA
ncbi:uncharacterized protein LOC141911189 [Tubulanus polymorphus]|uniref:uncharacterized protein LOC141911189 n=1 Tax=Tubulanus polymorphus TaxID=672921 RepID=UPI003DA60413